MSQRAKKGIFASMLCLLLVGVATVLVTTFSGMDLVVHADPTGIKYTGAGSCAAAACHGAPAPKEEEACRHNENTMWGDKDQHSKSFSDPKKGLVSPEGKEIAEKMKLGDASKAERCLTCHALSGLGAEGKGRVFLKADQIDAAKYNVADGNSCDACHGPASKYLPAHTAKGWTAGMRKTLGSQKLYDEWGLYDTKNLKFRANQCLSCHLKIDADMVAAGHPELSFELDAMSNPATNDWVHWRDAEAWKGGKAWAMGQVIALREAALQLADRIGGKADEKLVADSYKTLISRELTSRQIAKALDAGSLTALDAQLTIINGSWADGAKVVEALKATAKAADALADKFNDKPFDKAITETLAAGVASEGDQAAKSGFKSAEQFSMALTSLWGSVKLNAKLSDADGKAKQDKIDALYDPLGDKGTYSADKFGPEAGKMKDVFSGGASLPLPAGGPK